ncbi:GNAT family N-acetyltransferase [Magnetospira sp. QH-2]|uniref:lipid II:glycine glycyltransferase FemX n=1 Tax=Magnetospira sp. (strain QH-2) TaxID=1288970 RepID=UPI0003E81932|nr:GNAT family N-acetyltransferase [Magnetospira sp. QH-2]CCQ75372.1 conserved protein of unknown function [Magnetospira sp. QH-2]
MAETVAGFVPFDGSREDWDHRASGQADHNLLQTWAYGEAKAATGPWQVVRGLIRSSEGSDLGMAQVLVRPLSGGLSGGLAWLNRGPLCGGRDPGPLLQALRREFAIERGLYLRLAPVQESLPSIPVGFEPTRCPGWASARLDLSPDEPVLRKNLKQKWRNGLNKAVKMGLTVSHGSDDESYGIFRDAHAAFLGERGFGTTVTPGFLDAWRLLEQTDQKPVALIARRDGELMGSALMARYGNNWEYMAGNQTDAGRNGNAGQLLLWSATLLAREAGAQSLDLGGMDENLTPPGILRFKQGLGGLPYRLAPEIEALPDGLIGALTGRLVRRKVNKARAQEGAGS